MRISDWSSDVCSSDLEMGTRYGVQILWPVLLVQHRMLRVSLGYLDHAKRHQAITYALEAVIERSEERRVGKEWSVRVDLGGRRIIKKKHKIDIEATTQ